MVKTRIKLKELNLNQRKGLTQPVSFALMATALSSCGGGGGGGTSNNNNTSINTDISTTIGTVFIPPSVTLDTPTDFSSFCSSASVGASLCSYIAPSFSQAFSGTYSSSENLVVSEFNQAYADNYSGIYENETDHEQYEYTSISDNKNINALIWGYNKHDFDPNEEDKILVPKWKADQTNKLSYSFFNPDLKLLNEEEYKVWLPGVFNNSFSNFTNEQKQNIRKGLAEFEKVTNIKFVEVIEQGNQVGTVRFGLSFSDSLSGTASKVSVGAAFPPDFSDWASDIWIFKTYIESEFKPGEDRSYKTILHETAHALGLSHPHDDDSPFNATDLEILPSELDYSNYTLMSYKSPAGAYTNDGTYTISNSLMVYDIQALQHLYGANNNYNAGNTKYTFDETKPFMATIWDGGGEDTIDLSNFDQDCIIDLNDGAYSTIRYENWAGENNLGIAFNCYIENVIGGSGDDVITGNELDNELDGGRGKDILYGGAGNDYLKSEYLILSINNTTDSLYGGTGNDVYISYDINLPNIIEYNSEGTDRVVIKSSSLGHSGVSREYQLPDNVEELFYNGDSKDTNTLRGNNLDNVILGHGGGDDIIYGGLGADTFLLYAGMGNDTVKDFSKSQGDKVKPYTESTSYDYFETSSGAIFTLSDNSSLELIYI